MPYHRAGMVPRESLVDLGARCRDRQPASPLHGVAGVDGDVQEHLLELSPVRADRRDRGIEPRLQKDVLADQAAEHGLGFADDRVQVQDPGLDHLLAATPPASLPMASIF